MKISFQGQYKYSPQILMRKCNYGMIFDYKTRKVNFVKKLGPQQYPRFHAYLDLEEGGFQVNLHLDQKKASYLGSKAHSGEYEGELVEHEGKRIQSVISSLILI